MQPLRELLANIIFGLGMVFFGFWLGLAENKAQVKSLELDLEGEVVKRMATVKEFAEVWKEKNQGWIEVGRLRKKLKEKEDENARTKRLLHKCLAQKAKGLGIPRGKVDP